MGKGGAAIRGGKTGKLSVDNRGYIGGGKGGSGGDGGDAIHIAEGLDVTIINNGVIAGGDAGHAVPGVPVYTYKDVDISFPKDKGIEPDADARGFKVAWVKAYKVERSLRDGWRFLEFHTQNAPPVRFRVKNPGGQSLILMMGRK